MKILMLKKVDIFRNAQTTGQVEEEEGAGGKRLSRLSLCPVSSSRFAGFLGLQVIILESWPIFGGSFLSCLDKGCLELFVLKGRYSSENGNDEFSKQRGTMTETAQQHWRRNARI